MDYTRKIYKGNMILFITPIKHLNNFTKELESLKQDFPYQILHEPTYSKVKKTLSDNSITTIFCAPNHQKFIIDDKLLKGSNVETIITASTGTNHITTKSVPIISIKNDDILQDIWSTAEHTLYLILSIVRKIKPAIELHDKNLGILGYGRVGKMVEKISKPLFKKVTYMDIDFVSPSFFEETDILSINCDLNKTTKNIVNKKFLTKFHKNIYVVNTARGECVNEDELVHNIYSGKVLGYATDVLTNEHSDDVKDITHNSKVLVTPHIAGVTIDAQEKAYKRAFIKWRKQKMNEQEFKIRQSINADEKNIIPTGQSPEDYEEILSYIEKHKPKCIVEYGSGFSTMLIKQKIDELELDTKFFSFEDNKHYYDIIQEHIPCTETMELVPFSRDKEHPNLGRYIHTYGGMEDVDFVIIDGPDVGRYGIHATTNAVDLKKKFPKNKIKVFIQGRKVTQEWYGFKPKGDNAWGEL